MNFKVLDKDSTKSWLRVCYIDIDNDLFVGYRLLASYGVMHRIEAVVPDPDTCFIGVFCTIPRSDLEVFKETMADLQELSLAWDASYANYCQHYFE